MTMSGQIGYFINLKKYDWRQDITERPPQFTLSKLGMQHNSLHGSVAHKMPEWKDIFQLKLHGGTVDPQGLHVGTENMHWDVESMVNGTSSRVKNWRGGEQWSRFLLLVVFWEGLRGVKAAGKPINVCPSEFRLLPMPE